MNTLSITRILAVDPRSSRLGFAVFELPIRLLDWGVRSVSTDASRSKIAEYLVRRYSVSLVLFRAAKPGCRRDAPGVRTMLRTIRVVARRYSIQVQGLTRKSSATTSANMSGIPNLK